MFTLSMSFTLLPGDPDDFTDLIVKHAHTMMEEEHDCLRCEVYRSQDEPEKFFLQMLYKNQDAADKSWPVLEDFHKAVKPWLAKCRILSWDRIV